MYSNDAEQLAQFANQLGQFQQLTYETALQMTAQFKRLGESWNDVQYERFAVRIENFNKQILQFLMSTENLPPALIQLAEQIDQYGQIS